MKSSRTANKPLGDRIEVLVNAGWRCWFCGADIGPGTATVAHLSPPTHGGETSTRNLCAACVTCCSRKGGKSIDQFRAYVRRRRFREASLAHDLTRIADDQRGLVDVEFLDRLLTLAQDLDRSVPPLTFHGED